MNLLTGIFYSTILSSPFPAAVESVLYPAGAADQREKGIKITTQ